MNWRPNNWEEIKCKCSFQSEDGGMVPHLPSMEVGADAMLEALKKEGTHLTGDTIISAFGKYPEIHVKGGTKGWIILIPEEK
jgi:hypothetical protein